ncbi:organic cation transporter protein-like isoform X1 [Patiria miniata]|uniref:Major facilitator superfamily (MFS) profile domain-containing protein n=1 Tax=Patiria miniata TaxID=46514 RepID=A0A914BPK7_PATMI|nr:organic cation transporter protein-like isoform X1 [Patiria miniata]
MKLEDIIPLLGNFGRYQFFMVCYMGLVSIVSCLTTLSNVFYAAGTDHWCKVLPKENCSSWMEFQDNCTDVKKSILLPPPENDTNSKNAFSSCKQWELPDGYVFDPYVPLDDFDNFTSSEVSCEDGWEYDTSQYKTTTRSDFDLVCDDNSLPSIAQSVYFIGFLVGSFVFGTISDWAGRKRSLVLGLLFWLIGFIVTSFSVNIYMYTAFRFLAAFGGLGAYISTYILLLEVVGKSWRNAVTMVAGIFFAVGYFFLATAAMFIREWRTLSLVLSVPSIVLLIPVLFVEESIRWLVSKGRIDEAEAVIRRIARMNKKTLPDVLFDQGDIHEQMELQKSKIPPSAIDLYRTPNMAVKTLNLQFNWMVNNLVYYGLSQSTGDLGVNTYWAFFVSGAVEIPALLYATFGLECFGRKLNLGILELIGGVACLATIFIPKGIWRIVVAMIGKFCISATFSIVYVYTVELFPTPVRAVGLGVSSVASRVGGILSPIILLLDKTVANLPMWLFGSSAILAGTLAFFLPETRGKKLPQTLEEGEAFGKCRCMGGQAFNDESSVELDGMDTAKEGVFAISNAVFDHKEEEKEYRDFSQQFTRKLQESSHM